MPLIFSTKSAFPSRSATFGILFSTAVRPAAVAKLVILCILSPASLI